MFWVNDGAKSADHLKLHPNGQLNCSRSCAEPGKKQSRNLFHILEEPVHAYHVCWLPVDTGSFWISLNQHLIFPGIIANMASRHSSPWEKRERRSNMPRHPVA